MALKYCFLILMILMLIFSLTFAINLSRIYNQLEAKETENASELPWKSWGMKTIMFVSAHPDDIEASAGGLIAQLTAQGTTVYYMILTNGDKGCGNPKCENWTSEQIAVVRYNETLNAAKVLGVPAENVLLLDYEDGMMVTYPEIQIIQTMVTILRQIKPNIVMTWFPYPNFDLQPRFGWADLGFHPDHQTVARILFECWGFVGDKWYYPHLGEAWPGLSEFYMWEFSTPSYYVDISTSLQNKINAFLAHETQYPSAELVKIALTLLGSKVATNTPGFTGKFAEGFRSFF